MADPDLVQVRAAGERSQLCDDTLRISDPDWGSSVWIEPPDVAVCQR